MEWYAASHAEWSPKEHAAYLPSGSKVTYYLQFAHDLEQREACASGPCRSVDSGTGKPCRSVDSGIGQGVRKKQTIATLATFLETWSVEVPWLVVCKSVSMFTRCSVCEYLRLLIDQTPVIKTNSEKP